MQRAFLQVIPVELCQLRYASLFGPSTAVQERDRELVNDGRAAVGMTVGIPKRQADKPKGPKDDLDKLVDDLDNLGL